MLFVLGKAGSSKTTSILKTIKGNFVCLAYTHSAITNMKNIYNNLNNDLDTEDLDNFQTIHPQSGRYCQKYFCPASICDHTQWRM